MGHNARMKLRCRLPVALAACALACAAQAQSGDRPVYRCPGTPVL